MAENAFKADWPSFALGFNTGKSKGGGGGAELNIHYSLDTPPTDTSKLWVKSDKATAVRIAGDTLTGDSLRTASVQSFGSCGLATNYPITATVDGKVYLIGGGDANNGKLNTIRIYDPLTSSSTLISETLPIPLNGTGCGVVGKNIFIFGGDSGGSPTNSLFMFDTIEQKITDLSDLYRGHIGSTKLEKISCVAVGDVIHLFGGVQSSGIGISNIYRFNGAERRFMGSGVNIPINSNGGYICAHVKDVDDLIYIFNGTTYGNVANFFKYNCRTQTVTKLSASTTDFLSWVPACTIDGKVYIFGMGKKIYCFDPSTEEFALMEATTIVSSGYTRAVPFEHGALIFGGNSSTVQNFLAPIDTMPLENGHLKIVPAENGINPCQFINTESLKMTIGVKEVYKGDENNEGQPVEAAVYLRDEWQTI